MRNCSKANKRKVWRKTYGKVFLRKRAAAIAMMSVVSAQGVASIGMIAGCGAAFAAMKAVAAAECAIATAKAASDHASDVNKGFVRR